MCRIAGVFFVFLIFSLAPGAAQSPQYRRLAPPQEECPQGRQIRTQKGYPSTMTDCEVLDADTAAENQKLPRRTGRVPDPPTAPAPQQESQADKTARQIAFDLSVGYASISVDDFLLDAKDLATTGKKIAIEGYYRKFGNLEGLYASQGDAYMAATASQTRHVSILTDDAVRELRAYFLKCGPGVDIQGCWTRVRGHASVCEITLFGQSAPKPCLIVESGWSLKN
jgi:hypothetical protein